MEDTNIELLGLENPLCSTDDVWRGTDQYRCLTDDLDTIEANIRTLQSGKANTSHTHSGYVSQSDLSLLEDVINEKANASHTHSEYSLSTHTHDGYASAIELDTLEETVSTKANIGHTHTEYAPSSHTHSEYAETNHSHSDYASTSHSHNNYATTTALNEVSDTLSGKANISHSHNDIYYTETEIDTKLAGKANTTHTHTGVYDASGSAANALTSANTYTDTKVANLINGAPTTLDTLKEIADAMAENDDVVSALNTAVGTKANTSDLTSHTSNKSNPHNVILAQLGLTATAAEINKMDGVTATTTELNYIDGVTSNIQTQLNGKAASSHTHNYAGSSSAGGAATSANKLNTNAGSATQPVYFANGVPVATTYTLGKSVPSNAVFTDTDTKVTNTLATTTKAYVTGTTSATTNTGTQVFDTGVYLDTTAGKLTATTFGGTTFTGSGVATISEVETYLGI